MAADLHPEPVPVHRRLQPSGGGEPRSKLAAILATLVADCGVRLAGDRRLLLDVPENLHLLWRASRHAGDAGRRALHRTLGPVAMAPGRDDGCGGVVGGAVDFARRCDPSAQQQITQLDRLGHPQTANRGFRAFDPVARGDVVGRGCRSLGDAQQGAVAPITTCCRTSGVARARDPGPLELELLHAPSAHPDWWADGVGLVDKLGLAARVESRLKCQLLDLRFRAEIFLVLGQFLLLQLLRDLWLHVVELGKLSVARVVQPDDVVAKL